MISSASARKSLTAFPMFSFASIMATHKLQINIGADAARPLPQIFADQLLQLYRIKRLDQVLVRAQRQPLFHIFFASLGGNYEQWNRLLIWIVPDIADQLKPVYVRHIDVGDDQVDLFPREEPQRIEKVDL